MGQVLGAVCECGYKSEAVLGAGRSNFREVCKFPHYCTSCNEVISVDIFKEERICPKCQSRDVQSYEARTSRLKYKILEKFSDETLKKFGFHRRDDEQHSWYGKSKNHTILKGNQYCPNCQKKELKFFTSMMFD